MSNLGQIFFIPEYSYTKINTHVKRELIILDLSLGTILLIRPIGLKVANWRQINFFYLSTIVPKLYFLYFSANWHQFYKTIFSATLTPMGVKLETT